MNKRSREKLIDAEREVMAAGWDGGWGGAEQGAGVRGSHGWSQDSHRHVACGAGNSVIVTAMPSRGAGRATTSAT